jgi:hypothetical protein
VVLIFGEGTGARGSNDARALVHLLKLANPDLRDRYDIKAMKRPVSLTRTAKRDAVRSWLSDVESVAKAALTDVAAIIIHRDSDGPDPQGRQYAVLAKDLTEQLSAFPAVPAVPVQMIEAWWFLFPDAVRAVAPGAWRDLKLPTGDVETVSDPKRHLVRLTDKTPRTYRESDSEEIAKEILAQGRKPVRTSKSWTRFVDDARRIGG